MEPLPAVVEKRKSEAERESREEGEATQMGQVRFSISVLVSSFTIKKRRLKWARSDHQACASPISIINPYTYPQFQNDTIQREAGHVLPC